jgi:hypothetical protein
MERSSINSWRKRRSPFISAGTATQMRYWARVTGLRYWGPSLAAGAPPGAPGAPGTTGGLAALTGGSDMTSR